MAVVAVQQRQSAWQPLESFPRDVVPALAATWSNQPGAPGEMMICAGTSNVGIGCTQEGRTWNIFQQDLPTGDPATPKSNEFSGAVRGVQAMSIDAANPRRILAFFWDGKAYLSENGGLRWRQIGNGLPADPGYVSDVALHGDAALAIIDSRLYGSQDGGETWASLDHHSQPFWGQVHDGHIDGASATAYVATDNGLYAAANQPSWRWQRVIQLPGIRSIVQRPGEQEEFLFVATGSGNQSALYRWSPGQPARLLASFAGAIQSLAADPDSTSGVAAYILLDSGEVTAVSETGAKHSLGRRPGWPWDQSFDLLAAPSTTGAGSLLLLGHTNGLLGFNGVSQGPARDDPDSASLMHPW
jgi:hypothetical protein